MNTIVEKILLNPIDDSVEGVYMIFINVNWLLVMSKQAKRLTSF